MSTSKRRQDLAKLEALPVSEFHTGVSDSMRPYLDMFEQAGKTRQGFLLSVNEQVIRENYDEEAQRKTASEAASRAENALKLVEETNQAEQIDSLANA